LQEENKHAGMCLHVHKTLYGRTQMKLIIINVFEEVKILGSEGWERKILLYLLYIF
jgi:hypothetical protein